MATSFVPIEERQRIARARTTAPGGGYRFKKPEPPKTTGRATPAEKAAESKAAMNERLSEETELEGKPMRPGIKPKGSSWQARDYSK